MTGIILYIHCTHYEAVHAHCTNFKSVPTARVGGGLGPSGVSWGQQLTGLHSENGEGGGF